VARYVIRPRSDGEAPPGSAEDTWFTDPLLPGVTVSDHEPVFTGLLDSKGEEIWRAPREIGFGRNID
jgi:hypothetical protein